MTAVDIFKASRMQQIEDTTVVGGLVDSNGNLLLNTRDGTEINAGYVVGPKGEDGTIGLNGAPGDPAIPAGTIALWASDVAPVNWLICDGSAVSRTLYPALFNAIGTRYGVGDGSTTFNLPNLKGKTPIGLDAAQTEFNALAKTGGEKTHLLSISELPSHTHAQNAHTHIQDAHNHDRGTFYSNAAPSNPGTHLASSGTSAFYSNAGTGYTADGGGTGSVAAVNQSTTAVNQTTGGGSAHNILQPYSVVNFIIKSSAGETSSDSELATRVGVLEGQISDNVLQVRDRINKVQALLSGGGVRRVTSTAGVSWNQRFIALGIGLDTLSPSGYFDILMPPDGTSIPAYNYNINNVDVNSITVGGGYIPLAGWCTLYYDLPLGQGHTSDPTRFKLVAHQNPDTESITVPATWIPIVTHNVDTLSAAFWWGDGRSQDYWHVFTMANGWIDYGGTYPPMSWKFGGDGSIHLRGLVKNGAVNTATPVYSFDTSLGPDGERIYITKSGAGTARIDTRANGDLLIMALDNGATNGWVSLDGIYWYPKDT